MMEYMPINLRIDAKNSNLQFLGFLITTTELI